MKLTKEQEKLIKDHREKSHEAAKLILECIQLNNMDIGTVHHALITILAGIICEDKEKPYELHFASTSLLQQFVAEGLGTYNI